MNHFPKKAIFPNPMNQDPSKSKGSTVDGWQPCPAHTIGKMLDCEDEVKKLVMRRTLILGGAVTLTAVVAGVWNMVDETRANEPIRCSEVIKNLPAYLAKTINDRQLVRRIEKHLVRCGRCARKRDQMSV